jgi:excisionase family DNA binding protein
MQQLLTAKEVAPRLQMSTGRIYELVRLGILPAVRFGKQVRFHPDALAEFVASGGRGLADDS